MERIIINEIDNTSNVESLSSYDVVYVPGFSNVVQDKSLFRIPTLVTSKYQFLNLFGDSAPVFEYDQPYPIASTTTAGFPSYAIPNFSDLIIDSDPVELTHFTELETLEYYYVKVDVVAPAGEEDWTPTPNTNYFLRTGTTDDWTMSYSLLPVAQGSTYVETYGASGSNNVYASNVNPKVMGWYELNTSGGHFITGDTQISPDETRTSIKSYYLATQNTPPMFYANDADPGYRYALYLLSLGIPVYYEQMNSVTYDELNLTSDWASSLIKYGTSSEQGGVTTTYISPYEHGWYYMDGVNYKKCTDANIKYTEADQVQTSWFVGADISLDSLYTGLENRFMHGTILETDPEEKLVPDYSFDNIGDYSIKYITAGGYPVFEYGTTDAKDGLAYAMIHLAWKRGDAVALIDHTNNPERSIYETDQLSVVYQVRDIMADYDGVIASHGAMFTPWYTCTHSAISGGSGLNYDATMPASLAFLSALSTQLKNYNPWLAVSGVTRGKIPYFGSLYTNYTLTNNVADSYQTVPTDEVSDYALISINPITYIRQYGYCIWGNRTLRNNKSGTKASSFLNIRNTVSDIKKTLYEASQQLLFEQNTDLLWINFKSLVTPLLETMVSNNILSEYKMIKYNVDPDSGEAVPAYKILANIRIKPINSVEVFDLTVQLENNDIAVEEVQ